MRGDAIAGLMIVGINVVGGIIIGVAQKGMSFVDATQTFTLLTVGDGLVSQMPALIVSTAAGLMVSKAGVEGSTDKALIGQLSFYPQALGMVSAVMGIVAVLPGMPTLVFAGLSAATGGARLAGLQAQERRDRSREKKKEEQGRIEAAPKEEPISTALALDLLRVELGYGLLPLINDVKGHRITDQIKALRRQLAQEMGFVMPSVRILDNMQLGANEYRIRVKEVDAGRGELFPGSLLVMDPEGLAHRSARHAHDRARLRPARHLDRADAARRGIVPRLYRGRSGHGAHHASDRSAQEQHVRAALLRRDQEAARRSAGRTQEAGGGTHPVADLRHRRAARAADAARGARLDPRPARRSWKASPKRSATPRTRSTSPSMCARGWRASSATQYLSPGGYLPHHRAVAGLGTGLRRIASSARAKTASSPWRRRSFSNSSSRCATASTKPPARATCRCC